jgi:predicted transcriptional regulator
MNFKTAAKLSNCLSKDYAESFFRLLVDYRDISASEAASRLNLHINTAKEFLESLTSVDLVDKKEVYEGKRPYFRYSMTVKRISIDIDLSSLKRSEQQPEAENRIREAKVANARFITARNGASISSIAVWTGKGRSRNERRINLTAAQGLFLFHLPFPDGEALTAFEIMKKADIDRECYPEIQSVVELLNQYEVIEQEST